MRFICAQHVPFEPPGNLALWAWLRGDQLDILKMYDAYEIPSQSDFDGLIVLGGPMSVNDEKELPWLVDEKALVRETIRKDKPVLGICLGAQMIADVLGASVRPMGYREIGLFPVDLVPGTSMESKCFRDLPETFTALHWHGETFGLPTGARHLAKSTACPHQAFEIGSALGLQFHVEMGTDYLPSMGVHCSQEIQAGGSYVQSLETMQTQMTQLGHEPYTLLVKILENWLT